MDNHVESLPIFEPSRYIDKVSLATGEILEEDILPKQLLVQSHRDYHVVDVYSRFMMSWMVDLTGNEELVRQTFKELRRIGHKAADTLAGSAVGSALGLDNSDKVAQTLFGLKDREYFFRFKKSDLNEQEIQSRIQKLKQEAHDKFAAIVHNGVPRIRVLLTGGTGFVGKDILWRAARHDAVEEVVVLIRPKVIRDRKTKEVLEVLSPEQRGQELLEHLWLADTKYSQKFRFLAGDIEQPRFGIADEDFEELRSTVTHVIHCAASVSFDAPYDESIRANVHGTLNALAVSHELQNSPESPFVSHVSIETSYIHGRQWRQPAREDEIVFPRNFYNNYYELTKAMASIEAECYMLKKGLRLVQICPSIVVGESRTGNNRGDLKVVNAPVNAFGRAETALQEKTSRAFDRTRTWVLWNMLRAFPADRSAELNLIPVDRVSEGIVAALYHPEAVGERIHIATDQRITAEKMRDILFEELGVRVNLVEPTLHRNVRLPLMTKVLSGFKQERLAGALEKLGNIFGGYSEWGQPEHEVGNDVRLLGLSPKRPSTESIYRVLCRHNKYVQQFGQIRDLNEISRREHVWWGFIEDLEQLCGKPAGELPTANFEAAVEMALDLESFVRKGSASIDNHLPAISRSHLSDDSLDTV